jgi:cytochrome P450
MTLEQGPIQTGQGPLDAETIANPYPRYHYLRVEDPVHWHEGLNSWVLTRYPDVMDALRDRRLSADRMSSVVQVLPPAAQQMFQMLISTFDNMMLMSDPPKHTRLRSLANKAFTPRVVEQMRSHIQTIVDELLDDVEGKGRMDMIQDLAYPLPAIVIAEMLGVAPEDRDNFKKWSDDLANFLGNVRMAPETAMAAQQSTVELTNYFKVIIEERRENPQDDLMSNLVAAEEEGDRFSEEELYAMCILLLGAGHETTTNLIGNGTLALLQNPDQLQKLKDSPSLIEPAVEELLRYDSPVQSTSRLAMEDLEIGGKQIAQGESITITLGAANRDPDQFADPDRLDITRQDSRHMAFGFGPHFCLGSALARLEGQIAFGTLLKRMPNLRLEGEADELEWRDNPVFRGVKSLPVAF